MTNIKVFGEHDERTIKQLERCAEKADYAVLCADGHLGYSQPIGGVVAYKDHVSPTGVGYDIACGNKAVKTSIRLRDINVSEVMDEISKRISFGIGRNNNEPVDHEVLEVIRTTPNLFQRGMVDMASRQLGTVGSGNHYVDLFIDDREWIWIGVHFGSRGFGHKTATHYMEKAKEELGTVYKDDYDSPPLLLSTHSELGQEYLYAMELAGQYAYAGRDVVVDKVLEILQAQSVYEVHNHHNFSWQEFHFGQIYNVVRKGATPAFDGQEGFVGGSMGDISVILEGTPKDPLALASTVHGAGRVMSRTEAAGKYKKGFVNNVRDDDSVYEKREDALKFPGASNTKKVRVRRKGGKIDWKVAQRYLELKGVELRGGGADEAPGVYRNLREVLQSHGDSVRIKEVLHPVGVAMAGPDVRDPYKD